MPGLVEELVGWGEFGQAVEGEVHLDEGGAVVAAFQSFEELGREPAAGTGGTAQSGSTSSSAGAPPLSSCSNCCCSSVMTEAVMMAVMTGLMV
jgi:hypothetical protein